MRLERFFLPSRISLLMRAVTVVSEYTRSGCSLRTSARLLLPIGYFAPPFGFLVPYLLRPLLRCTYRPTPTPWASSVPRTMWYRTPGRSLTLPPRISTTECSWRLCFSPGMYAVTSWPPARRTLAILRKAEFGFSGVWVFTALHTPRRWGDPLSAGVL